MPKLKKYILITQFNVTVERIKTHQIIEHETQQKNRNPATKNLIFSLLILSLYPLSLATRPFVFILSQDDFKDATSSDDDDSPPDPTTPHDSSEWDKFGSKSHSPHKSEDELNPSSWLPIFELDSSSSALAPPDPVPTSESDSLLIGWPWRSMPCKVSLAALATSIRLKKMKA